MCKTKIPPPQESPKIELPPFPDITFDMPRFNVPTFDPEAVERKKEAKRQEELRSIIARRGRGREGTIKNVGGASGLDEESAEIARQKLIRKK